MKTEIFDPWNALAISDSTVEEIVDKDLSFEDDFVNRAHSIERDDRSSSRLPDSAEYIASLEKKLDKIRSSKTKKKIDLAESLNDNKSSILQSLEETHSSYMTRLVSCDSEIVRGDDEFILDTPTNRSSLMNYVQPEKQALTVGELVEFIKYDQLAEVLDEQDNNPKEKQ